MDMIPPLMLERQLERRLWGGTRLGAWLGLADADTPLAESWQVYADNRVAGGPYAGATLAELCRRFGAALVGRRAFARTGTRFPLLLKFIDAAAPLSIQVHPDDHYAHTVEAASGFDGKTEAWVILHAEPGATVFHGLRQATTPAAFRDALAAGEVLSLLREVPVRTGDVLFVPAGTLHAINGGIVLFEVQQTSDLTYRVYDYDRRDANGQPRELHLAHALAVTDWRAAPPLARAPVAVGAGRTQLVQCVYFELERWQIQDGATLVADGERCQILTVIDGTAVLGSDAGEWPLARGTSLVVPAAPARYQLHADAPVTLLWCSVP